MSDERAQRPLRDRAEHGEKAAPGVTLSDTLTNGLIGRGALDLARAVRSGSLASPPPANPITGFVRGPLRDETPSARTRERSREALRLAGVTDADETLVAWLVDLPLNWPSYGQALLTDTAQALAGVLAAPNGSDVKPSPYPRSPADLEPVPAAAPRLLGVLGLAESGKDELADLAQRRYANVARLAFSDTIMPEVNEFLVPRGCHVDHAAKKHPAYGRLLQAWGAARRVEDPDHWIRKVHAMIDAERAAGADMVIVTGLRLVTNPDTGTVSMRDVEAIREIGGQVWNVDRPGNPNRSRHHHYNESALARFGPDAFDGWVTNAVEGDLQAFHDNVAAALEGRPQPHQA